MSGSQPEDASTRVRSDIHISSVSFEAPLETVWRRLSDPLRFPDLYPSWTRTVERGATGSYAATTPAGDRLEITPHLDRDQGVIDFEVVDANGDAELSRSRLLATPDGGCVLVHVACRWGRMTDRDWERHRCATDSDLVHAKRTVESSL